MAPPFCIEEISYQATQKLVGYYRILATAALSGKSSLKQPLHRRVQDFLLLILGNSIPRYGALGILTRNDNDHLIALVYADYGRSDPSVMGHPPE